MKSVKYLERLRAQMGNPTNSEVADRLKITAGGVSHYMTGRRIMDDETCLAVALALNIDPMEVLGAAFLDRAEKTGQKSLWEVFMTRAAMTAGAVLMASGVNLFLTTGDANAASMRVADPATSVSIDYAKYAIPSRMAVMRHINQFSPAQQIRRTACAGESSHADSRPCSWRALDADHFPRPHTPFPPYVNLASTRSSNIHRERSAIARLAAVLDCLKQFDVLDFLLAARPATALRSTRSPMSMNQASWCRATC